jgi:methionyl-tRNA formyltransferase
MKIVVIGAGASARYCLQSLIKGKYNISGIITLDDSVSKQKATFRSVEDLSNSFKIPLLKVTSVNEGEVIKHIKSWQADLIVVMGWSEIITQEILDIPPKGVIGTHLSMLPKDRGHSPLNWAILRGEKKWGTTLFYLAERVDAGAIISQREFDIDSRDNIQTLYNTATFLGIEMLMEALPKIKNNVINPTPQEILPVKPLPKRSAEDGLINWESPCHDILNLVRAVSKPFPGAFTYLKQKKLTIWEASNLTYNNFDYSLARPGEIITVVKGTGVIVATSTLPLLIKRISIMEDFELWADHIISENDVGVVLSSKI